MLQQYSLFYRQVGVRKINALLSPNLTEIYQLPREACYHDVAEIVYNDDVRRDVQLTDAYIKGYTKRIPVVLIDSYQNPIGLYTKRPRDPAILSRDFFKENASLFRRFKSGESHNDPLTVMVYNYGYLSDLYVYPNNTKTELYKHANLWRTVWKNACDNALQTKRNQFVVLNFDADIPGMSLLNMFQYKELSNTLVFNTDDKLMMLDLWRWADPASRHLSYLSDVDISLYPKMNLIIKNKTGKASLLNLGYLNSWIKNQTNQTEFNTVQQVEATVVQRVLLKHMLLICEGNVQEPLQELTDNPSPSDEEEIEDADDSSVGVIKPVSKKENVPATDEKNSPLANVKEGDELVVVDLNKQLKDLDKELKETDEVYKEQLSKKGIFLKDGDVQEIAQEDEDVPINVLIDDFVQSKDPTDMLKRHAAHLADEGMYTASEYRKVLELIDKSQSIPDPYGSKLPISEVRRLKIEDVTITKEKSKIETNVAVFDESMKESSLISFDQDYIEKAMKSHMVAMVSSIQKSGVIVTDHTVTHENTILGSKERHQVTLKPLRGNASTIYMDFPKVDQDGHFVVSSNKYLMRKQRVDLPIRKISASEVALTSYYGKTFVTLSEKKSDSSVEWLCRKIYEASFKENPIVTEVAPADVYDNEFESPWLYGMLAKQLRSFKLKNAYFCFDHTARSELLVNDQDLNQIENAGERLVGITAKGEYLRMKKEGIIEVYRQKIWMPLGTIPFLLEVETVSAPVDFSVVNVFSKAVPIGFVLGNYMGFKNLLKLTKVQYRIVEGRKQKDLQEHEFAVSFQDISYIFSRNDVANAMIFGGYLDFEKQIKKFPAAEFNKPAVYYNLLESKKLTSIYLTELESMKDLFVDPITDLILQSMNEPRTFVGLLLRANELLMTCHHPNPQDMLQMRIRGYERFVGAAYKQLVDSVRQFKSKNTAGKGRIEMSPYATWGMIMKDPANKLAEEINPIQSLKEQEIVTYVGEGGRGKESMSKKTRAYHKSDMGVISEATVDSSDVGVNMYMSPNPQFANTLGVVGEKNINAGSVWSTSALLAPGSDKDDFKRVNFVNIQQGHTVSCPAYHQPYVNTGYEHIIGHRTNGMFCYTAKQDGKVKSLGPKGVIVEYKDGTLYGVELGRVFGKAEGSVYPHDIVPYVKEGQSFKKGQTIAYNSGFFEPYMFDPTTVVYKGSKNMKVVLVESSETHEDGCAISAQAGKELYTQTTKIKSIVIDFNQSVLDVVKPGQALEPGDVFLIVEDQITSSGSFDEDSLRALRKFSKQAPKVKYRGVVDKIEVYYNGEKSDMTESLRRLTDQSDKLIMATCKETNKPVVTGQVTEEYRVKGAALTIDKAEIKIYMTVPAVSGVGDKLVFVNQMKSVIGRVMRAPLITESGTVIDAKFSYLKILGRICKSPIMIGMTTTLLKVIGKSIVRIYEGEK